MSKTTPGGSTTRPARSDAGAHHDAIEIDWSDASLAIRHEPYERRRARPPQGRDGFTPRQIQILKIVADGSSNAEIATRLGISRRTVEKHIEAIHSKAGTASRARLVAYAMSALQSQRD